MALFWIKVVVFLDFFAVSLVVPLLSAYFRDAGVDTKLYGLITSLYSVSQLFGGVAMGIMSDIISKRDVLLLSFAGSAVSYLLVGTSTSTYVLFGSRILVGLVKQTMTVSTSAISELTEGSTELRSKELGRLSAISTASFIVGPSMGSILYRMDKRAPAVVAAACFVINMIICMVMMPQTGVMISTKSGKEKSSGKEQDTKAAAAPSSITQFLSTVKDVAQIPGVLTILSIRILVSFLESGTSSKLIVNYYEGRFGVQTYQLGFMSTAWALLSSLAQTFLVVPSTRYFG
jgi:MFS family permease